MDYPYFVLHKIVLLVSIIGAFYLIKEEVLTLFGVIKIPSDSFGVVYKKTKTVDGINTIVSLNGEPGYQADTLKPGYHYWIFPWNYDVEILKQVVIPEGHLGVIEARIGKEMPHKNLTPIEVESNDFQDVRKFIENGGQKGIQPNLLSPGMYRINPSLFHYTIRKETFRHMSPVF